MKEDVLNLLDKNNMKYDLIEHEIVHTIEDMDKLSLLDKGIVCKNLFLRDAKGKIHIVLSCPHEKDVKLDEISKKLGTSRLSFGSAERLDKYLKLENGYVSPFGVINDESKSVIFVFDKDLQGKEKIGFHPNINTSTIFLAFKDVRKVVEDHGNDALFIRL